MYNKYIVNICDNCNDVLACPIAFQYLWHEKGLIYESLCFASEDFLSNL